MNIYALLAGLFSGILGSMGLGGGAVLIIYLTLFTETEQLAAQGINLLFFIPIALVAVTVYAIKKQIKWNIMLTLSLGGLIGSLAGIFLADFLGGEITSKIFGAGLVILGFIEIFKRKNKNVDKTKK